MTEEQTPPDADAAVADVAPLPPEVTADIEPRDLAAADSDAKPEGGIGLGAGIAAGAAVGVLGAVVAALWFGSAAPPDTGDAANAPDGAAAAADTEPGRATPLRPATGTDIVPAAKTGGGTLVLQNVGTLDAVVVLADKTTFARAVYVRTDERVTVPNVSAGTYEVLMLLGRTWDGGRFVQAATYQQLDQPIEFAERDTASGTEYTQLTVSIEPVTPGLIGVRPIAPFQLTGP